MATAQRVHPSENDELNASTIGEFVEKSDALGGPTSPQSAEFWAGKQYVPSADLSRQLDPLSPEYMAQQMALYEEITGHGYAESRDEMTDVPVADLTNAPNAYGYIAPRDFAQHCVALGSLVQMLNPSADASLLELGSGWGFCQEFLAACGLQTKGIEGNAEFVRSSNLRLDRLGFGERVVQMNFSEIDASVGKFDYVLAYEAFHHAVDPLALLKQARECLKDDGQLLLAAEPFNDFYQTWGLRFDPISIYCIRKFGWFESGWSADYMQFLYGCVGLEAEYIRLPISHLTTYMIGRQKGRLHARQLGFWHPDVRGSVTDDGNGFFLGKHSVALLPASCMTGSAKLEIDNFNIRPLRLEVRCGDARTVVTVPSGSSVIDVPAPEAANNGHYSRYTFLSETFCPRDEGINDDERILGLRLTGVQIQ